MVSPILSALRVTVARALSALGREHAALDRLEDILVGAPNHRGALFHKGSIALQLGDVQTAQHTLRKLIADAPNFPRALGTLARASFPGPPYRQVLAAIHATLAPKTYLEIGVEFGLTLSLAKGSEVAVGVDPAPRLRRKLHPNTRVFAETSDDFFANHTLDEIFGGKPVEFAFIDGMHRFENVLRDFCEVERWSTPHSTVVLHDCLPVAPVSAHRERETQFWVGDTWKALECLLDRRPDLSIKVLPCYPSGLVLIRNLDPKSTVLREVLPALERQYLAAPYPYEPGSWPRHYPILENSLAALATELATKARSPDGSSSSVLPAPQ